MIGSIQLLRAFAAWIVVFHHYIEIFYGLKADFPIGRFLANYGAIGVDIFFVISGFVIYTSTTKNTQSPLAFAKQRLLRIVPAYWTFTIIVAVSLWLAPNILFYAKYNHEFLLKSMLFIPTQNPAGIGLFPLVTVGWTLNYEMAFYAIFFIALFLNRRLLLPAICIGLVAMQYLAPKLGGEFTFYGRSLIYEFLLGIAISVAHQKNLIVKIKSHTAMTILVAAITILWSRGNATHDPLFTGIPCALIVVAFISLDKYVGNFPKANRLGDWSYSTYLCHPIITFSFLYLYKHEYMGELTALILTCASVAAASWASYNFIERPILRLAKPKSKPMDRMAAVN